MNDSTHPRRSHGGLLLGVVLGAVVLGGLLVAALLAGALWLGASAHHDVGHAAHAGSVPVEAR